MRKLFRFEFQASETRNAKRKSKSHTKKPTLKRETKMLFAYTLIKGKLLRIHGSTSHKPCILQE